MFGSVHAAERGLSDGQGRDLHLRPVLHRLGWRSLAAKNTAPGKARLRA